MKLLGGLGDPGNSKDNELDAIYQSFKRLAENITSLTLTQCRTSLQVLKLFPSLKDIMVNGVGNLNGSKETADDDRAVGVLLAQYQLTKLTLGGFDIISNTILDIWLALDWKSASSLQLLDIRTDYCDTQYLQFISKFSTTLQRLSLDFRYNRIDPLRPSLSSHTLSW